MRVHRSIKEPIRPDPSWEELWAGPDRGLISCWERGRELAGSSPESAVKAIVGHLIPLGWKGGIEAPTKLKKKVGTLFYLAKWQGLRGDDLDIDLDAEVTLTCEATGVHVTFTGDLSRYGNA